MAATADRDTANKAVIREALILKNDEVVYAGTLAALDENDEGVNVTADADLRVRGMWVEGKDNADDGLKARCERGPGQWFKNSGTTPLVADDIGHDAYVEDNETLIASPASTCKAGKVYAIDSAKGVLITPGEFATNDPAYLAPAADAALQLGSQLHGGFVKLNSGAGAKAITTANRVRAGTRVVLYAGTVSGGSYTLAVTGGTLTLDAANEVAEVYYDGSAWKVGYLRGATIV